MVGLLRNNKDAVSKLKNLLEQNVEMNTSSINIHELIKGANLSNDAQKNLEKVKALMQSLNILSFDKESAMISGKLAALKEIRSKPAGQNDLFIASIAISNSLTLVTKNKKHFEGIPNIKIEGW